MRGSDSMIRSITSAWPGTRKWNCSAISDSVGGRPVAFCCCAAKSGILKNVSKSRLSAARSSGAVNTVL